MATKDFTVKVDATGLKPATTYHYRFKAYSAQSVVDRTRTGEAQASKGGNA